MSRYTIDEFIRANQQDDGAVEHFQLENDRMLEINLDGDIWIKTGSMVAYVGTIKFTREGLLEQGLTTLLKRSVSGEGTRLTKATGKGQLYLADSGKTVQIIRLQGESIVVNGSDLLAFEPTIKWEVKLMRRIAAIASGGFFNVRMQGEGLVAITTHFEPLALVVRPGCPVRTDPNATVCWSGSLEPTFKTDVSLKTFFGRGSGESIQMEFDGSGFVVIQPSEGQTIAAVPGA